MTQISCQLKVFSTQFNTECSYTYNNIFYRCLYSVEHTLPHLYSIPTYLLSLHLNIIIDIKIEYGKYLPLICSYYL